MSDLNKIDKLYDEAIAIVDQSLATVLNRSSDTNGNVALDEAVENSRALLEDFQNKINADIRELRELSEWNTFTIAFYGETNAGKSTLIETLRILLDESEKVATQNQFKKLTSALQLDSDSLAKSEESIRRLEAQLNEIQSREGVLERQLRDKEQHQIDKLQALKATIEQKRKYMRFWQRIVFLFRKLDEEKEFEAQQVQLVKLKAENEHKLVATSDEVLKLSTELEVCRSDQLKIKSTLAELEPLQDGNIIGNGRSDFTLQLNAYKFAANGQEFQLFDVPGIEGDESQVMGAIEESVKKAHAVFYVTRSATPPGSGSEGGDGTIGKIKRQLGQQTEVWAIYNKSATNPRVLQGEALLNANDSIGLLDMGKSLAGTLGADTYKGYMCVSGMPAFLATASCLLPYNPHFKSREKFLKDMSASDVLKRSGMDDFVHFIRTKLSRNFQDKIRAANLKKIQSCLQEGIARLNQVRKNFADAEQKLNAQQQSTSTQFDALLASTSQKLKSESHDHLTQMKAEIRKEIYAYIDKDQTNDNFKEFLQIKIEKLKTSIGLDLEKRFITVFESFKSDAGEIIIKNQQSVSEILRFTIDAPFSSLQLGFAADFKMKSGIDPVGLFSTFGSAALLIWSAFLGSNPVGWTAATVIGAVGLVFSLYKAVRGYLNSDYKKEQQRKSTNENLEKVFGKLVEMLDENIESVRSKINGVLQDAKLQMMAPYRQCVSTKSALELIAAEMIFLRDKIVTYQPTTITTFSNPAETTAAL